ncbi:RNA-directed DNA polymerase, eukaryota [Tanacetum coccineum]
MKRRQQSNPTHDEDSCKWLTWVEGERSIERITGTADAGQALDDNKDSSVHGRLMIQLLLLKDARNLIDEFFLPKGDKPTRWVKSVPIKVNVFAWKLFLDRLPTRLNLARRNVYVPSLDCPLCDQGEEDTSHLFFGCSAAKEVMKLICRWWDLYYQLVESYEEWFAWFKSIRLEAKSKDVLEGVFFVSWWSVWFYRNQLLFADASPRKSSIFDDITLRSYNWCLARGNSTLSWVSWLQHPHLIPL